MCPWSRFVLVVILLMVMFTCRSSTEVIKKLPKVDVFLNGSGGKPTLGSTGSTCWARGGLCMDMRHCTSLVFDASVPGCTSGFKVCCKNYKRLPPTVGAQRKSNEFLVYSSDFRELEYNSVRRLALLNANLLGMT